MSNAIVLEVFLLLFCFFPLRTVQEKMPCLQRLAFISENHGESPHLSFPFPLLWIPKWKQIEGRKTQDRFRKEKVVCVRVCVLCVLCVCVCVCKSCSDAYGAGSHPLAFCMILQGWGRVSGGSWGVFKLRDDDSSFHFLVFLGRYT